MIKEIKRLIRLTEKDIKLNKKENYSHNDNQFNEGYICALRTVINIINK